MFRRITIVLGAIALGTATTACEQALAPIQEQPALFRGSGSSNETRLEADLMGSKAHPDADGRARYRDRGGERELQIEVEDGPANTPITFFVDGLAVGSGTTDEFGSARLNLNSDDGDTVPSVGSGTTVSVEVTGGGVVADGMF